MSDSTRPRRRVAISSSDEEDVPSNSGGFLSDDDEVSDERSAPLSDYDDSSRERQAMKPCDSDESVSNPSPIQPVRNSAAETRLLYKTSENSSYSSVMSSTPISKPTQRESISSLTSDYSDKITESFDHISLDGSDHDEDVDNLNGTHDRSRSFLVENSEGEMSPISKRLTGKNDAFSKQKLRERLLRKTVVRKERASQHDDLFSADLSPVTAPNEMLNMKSSPAAISETESAMSVSNEVSNSPQDSNMDIAYSAELSSQLSQRSNILKSDVSTESVKACKRLTMDVFALNIEKSSDGAIRSDSVSSLTSLPSSTKSILGDRFTTPRKSEVIDLSSDDEHGQQSISDDDDHDGQSISDEDDQESVARDALDADLIEEVDTDEEVEDLSDEDNVVEESFVESSDICEENVQVSTEERSIVCLSSDDEQQPNEQDQPLRIRDEEFESNEFPLGKENVLVEKFSGYLLNDLFLKRDALKKTMSTINMTQVKDGGLKLRTTLNELESIIKVREKSERHEGNGDVAMLEESIVMLDEDEKPPSAAKTIGPAVIAAPNFDPHTYNRLLTNDGKRLFGGKMTDNRIEKVQTLTENALRGMHKAMTTVPDESKMIDTPKGLKIELMQHQKQGLAWLVWREAQMPPGGILADDMGLGKTLSMLSLVIHQKNERLKRKEEGNVEEDKKRRDVARSNGLYPSNATLVVAPASLIYQWEAEIEKRIKPDRLTVAVFHGPKNKRESNPKRLASHDIVITTFNLLTTEFTEKITTANNEDPSTDDDSADEADNWGAQAGVARAPKKKTKISKRSDSVLAKIAWDRVILDEAHQIKNKNTGSSKSACRLAATSRWCLTGTPIHNNLWDLYSLIRFMRVSPFDEEKHWKEYIMCSTQKAADRLNLLIKNLLLRRTKSQICNITKKPLVDLPAKVMKQHDLILEGKEGEIYDIMFTVTQQRVKQMLSEADNERYAQLYGVHRKKRAEKGEELRNPFKFGPRTIAEGDKFQQMAGMLVMLLRLRQACVHMHLTKEAVDMDAFETQGGDPAEVLENTLANLSLDESMHEDIANSAAQVFEKSYLSCKVRKLLEIVDDCMENNDKIVIVSQWTALLFIVEEQLKSRKLRYTSITGKVLPCDRQERVESFNKINSGARVMLLSLTAGGVGLNLIGGNHLVMVDLHWNPALEAQACDRIYRMGQKKIVYIHRLVTTGTIEQRVLDLQKKKLELAGSVLEGAASRKMNKLTMADLKFLFDLEPKRAPNAIQNHQGGGHQIPAVDLN